MNLKLYIRHIRFLFDAKGRHGLHSPFAYGFVEQVLRKKAVIFETPPENFAALDFQYLLRIIKYWKPARIRLFPELIESKSILQDLFPAIRIDEFDLKEAGIKEPSLWIGNTWTIESGDLPLLENPDLYKGHACVILAAAQSSASRRKAVSILKRSAWPMGIDFWRGIFLASDKRFRTIQRFQLKAFF